MDASTHTKKRRAWATQSVDDNHADSRRETVGRKQVSGSILMSKAESILVSAEAQAISLARDFDSEQFVARGMVAEGAPFIS